MNIEIFYNKEGILNRNKLKESWVKNNLPELYLQIINTKLPSDINHFSQKIYHYVHKMSDYPKCKYCNSDNKRYQSFTTGYLECCCKKCALKLVRPQVEKKRRENTLKKHGVTHTSKLPSTKKKQKETNERIYGFVSPACNDIVKEKQKTTNMKIHGVEYSIQIAGRNSSSYEEELCKHLNDELKLEEIVCNYRDGKEIDIYLPKYNLGIEINGLYWHSEIKRGENYHINKTNFFKERNIDILHIWEDDWLYKKEKVISLILSKINKQHRKINSNKCEVHELTTEDSIEFLKKNHINGYVSSDINIGLYFKNEIVSIMCLSEEFNNSRRILRFCDKLYYKVSNSANHLFDYFLDNYNTVNVSSSIVYDYNLLNDNFCLDLGFKLDTISNPSYSWYKGSKRYRPDEINEYSIYNKIWDSGSLEYQS